MADVTLAQTLTDGGGRRFLMTMGANIVNLALLVAGYIDQNAYQVMFLGSTAVYIGASTYQKVRESD